MSNSVISPEALDRRNWIRMTALALTSTGALQLEGAQHVHQQAAAEKKAGPYKPKVFAEGQWAALRRLTELIVPADSVSGSALDAGAPEFIDLLASQNPKIAEIFHGGLAWLDAEMRRKVNQTFVGAAAAQQTALLDEIVAAEKKRNARRAEEMILERQVPQKEHSAYTLAMAHPAEAAVPFFDWARKMTVDAFYTSPMGIRDIGFIGNQAYSKYEVPQQSIEYAMKRSPFGQG
jgi:gluconate 2-dehydrogenase gamma chain